MTPDVKCEVQLPDASNKQNRQHDGSLGRSGWVVDWIARRAPHSHPLSERGKAALVGTTAVGL